MIKIEENDVYNLLNDNLRDKITVYINGRILHNIRIFDNFSIEFLAKITFIFQARFYTFDDVIINEDEYGPDLFFINSGKVVVIHKKTLSYLNELKKDDYFGEISFFSNLTR